MRSPGRGASSSDGISEASPGTQSVKYEIDSAFQGLDGVAKAKEAREAGQPYRLAFVDMRMPPGIDGVDTIELLWKEDPDLQIVVCTAFSDYSWEETVERVGLTDQLLIIKKPFDQSEVCQAAAAMCEKWQLTQQAKLKFEDLELLIEKRTLELRQSNQQLEVESPITRVISLAINA